MEDNIVEIIAQYGLETILIAVVVNILTALIKTPIKYLANKTKHSSRITRFIVVLPLMIGFAITLSYVKLTSGEVTFGKEFVTLWLTSSSLSLTIYAVIEKMLPSKKSVLQDSETEMTEKIIDKLQTIADGVFNKDSADGQDNNVELPKLVNENNEQQQLSDIANEQPSCEKIVLRGKSYVQDEAQE